MAHYEFHHVLSSLGGLSHEQLEQLKRELDDRLPMRSLRQATDETVFELMNSAGLLGCLLGQPQSPRDLATNAEHMQGFGGA
jgi:hypothetical protein